MTFEFAAATLVPAQGQVNWRDHLPVHLAAELFPLMSEAELRELGEDIKKTRLRNPVDLWRDADGKVYLLDGRNRLDAMEMVGISFGKRYDLFRKGSKLARTWPSKCRSLCFRAIGQHRPPPPDRRSEA